MAQGGKTGKEIPESSRLEFLDGEDNTSGLLNRRDRVDLPLLRMLLAIRQKFQEPSFWEVMDSFILLGYASLAALRTLLQQLLACLNLFILLVQMKKVISMDYGSCTSS